MRLRLPTFPMLAAVLLLAGCGERPPAAEHAAGAPAAAPAAGAAALPAGWKRVAGQDVPSVPAAVAQLPVSVRSDDGVQVTVGDASRIIAGDDDVIAVAEALGVGGHIYAAPERSATPAGQAAAKHFLFNRNNPGAEGVLSLGGTLFLGNSLRRHTALAGQLRATGLPAVIVDDLQPAPDKVRKVAAALGLAPQGEELAARVQAQLDQAAAIAAVRKARPRLIVLSASGAGGKPTVAGRDSAATTLIRTAGGLNIGDEAGVANYSQLSNEGVVASAPEVILVTENDLKLFGGESGLWKAYPTLKQTPAGAANRVWVMPDIQLKATSVASGAGALALAQALSELEG